MGIIPDSPGGPNEMTWALESERGRRGVGKKNETRKGDTAEIQLMRRTQPAMAGFEEGIKKPWARAGMLTEREQGP